MFDWPIDLLHVFAPRVHLAGSPQAMRASIISLMLPTIALGFVRPIRLMRSSPRQVLRAGRLVGRLAMISTSQKGSTDSESFRIFFKESGKTISPWHNIPLKAGNDTFNFIVEIPKFTKAKMEVATKEELNPIAQDTKKGKLRFYHGPIFWNYGLLPQTWEDPNHVHAELRVKGDNDPVDVVEIGSKALPMGSVAKVKPLGVLAMIDDGELDWKIIAIDVSDPQASALNDVEDVEKKMPGVISGIREWFRWYKTPDEKPINQFGYDERALPRSHALKVIEKTHGAWQALVHGKTDAGKLWKAQ